jgi:hypothetical protein
MKRFYDSYTEIGRSIREEEPEVPLHPWRYEGWRSFLFRGMRYWVTSWQSALAVGGDTAPSATTLRVFDLATKQDLSLTDVVSAESFEALSALLTEEAIAMEGQSLQDARFFDSVVYPSENFGICEGGLLFYYNIGDLAPREVGERWYILGWEKLKGLLAPSFDPADL